MGAPHTACTTYCIRSVQCAPEVLPQRAIDGARTTSNVLRQGKMYIFSLSRSCSTLTLKIAHRMRTVMVETSLPLPGGCAKGPSDSCDSTPHLSAVGAFVMGKQCTYECSTTASASDSNDDAEKAALVFGENPYR